MTGDRYVLLGLAPPRAPWFESVARWCSSAALAAEFVKCVSAEEVRVRLNSGRLHSALMIDTSVSSFDRDLVDLASQSATPVIAVRDPRGPSYSGRDLGVTVELPPDFTQDTLATALATYCPLVARGDLLPSAVRADRDAPVPMWLAQLVVVCGAGGTGASTVAIALAQGFSADPRYSKRVLLADLARRADQAMLHDATDLGPGLQELVEAHRLRRPDSDEVVRTTFQVPDRGYRLLLGLRQIEAWAALRPRAIDATLEGLRKSFQLVVADVTGDFEGEADSGSVEVEERNHLARSSALQAAVVVAVGAPGLKGIHSLGVLIRSLVRAGVEPARIVAVVNRAPRSPRSRADAARALAAVLSGKDIQLALAGPVHVPERKIEESLRDGAPLPAAVVDPLVRAVRAVGERGVDRAPAHTGPTRIEPGSLGAWADQ